MAFSGGKKVKEFTGARREGLEDLVDAVKAAA
jgi:hypothetical protein